MDISAHAALQGLSLNPGHGSHLLLCNRSGARLSGGDAEGALEDACCALKRAPAGFPTATLRQVCSSILIHVCEAMAGWM